MKLLFVIYKGLLEQVRSAAILILTLAFGPFFIYLYYLFAMGGSTSYALLVNNRDAGAVQPSGERVQYAAGVIEALQSVAYAGGEPLLRVRAGSYEQAELEKLLKDRKAAAYLELPEDFSAQLLQAQSGSASPGVRITFGGDLTNPAYAVAAILMLDAVDAALHEYSGVAPVAQYIEIPLGSSASRTEFEIYAPGIFIFAVGLLVFTAAMTLAREVEDGTLPRLQLTRLSAFELLAGNTLVLGLVGVLALLLSYWTAAALGFRSSNQQLWLALLVGAVCSLSVIGLGLVVAAFSKTVSQAFVIANFPLGFFIFLSGAVFPLPRQELFDLFGHGFAWVDLIPPTHAVQALNKIFTLGVAPGEIAYELGMLAFLSALYFAIGVWLFQRRQMRLR